LKPVHSNISAQKRRHDSTRDEDNELEEDINYPLKMKNEAVKTQFLLKHPPKLLKSRVTIFFKYNIKFPILVRLSDNTARRVG
jgi:hypothetical protein